VTVLGDRALLEAWTVARSGSASACARALLEAALEPGEREGLEGWSLARRHAALLDLRASRWGPRLEALARCPECGEWLELELSVDDLRAGDPPAEELEAAGLRFRLPREADLEAVAGIPDAAAARRALAARCVLPEARPLDDAQVDALGAAMGEADRAGGGLLALGCPECGHAWRAPFDVAAFVAEEVAAQAHALLGEVHALARAYGWSEAEVLDVPPARRRAYLELAEA
jgi:hypothetical protein